MQVKIEWSARVNGREVAEDLLEFADEMKRGLIDAEMIPADAWAESASHDFSRHPVVTFRWDTESATDAGEHEVEALD